MGMFLRRGLPSRMRFSDLEIGQTIKLNVSGTPWEFLVVHQGLPSDIYDASCDGTWLLMKDIYENRAWNSSDSNVYETSAINTWLNGDFLGLLDSKIQSAIKEAKIPYRSGGGSKGTDQSGANGLSCKVFLLSGYEVGWTTSDSSYFPVDGAKLAYFERGTGTSANEKRIASLDGSSARWWLRSPFASGTSRVWRVVADGNYSNGYASYSYGIRPAFIMPSDFLVTDDMLVA